MTLKYKMLILYTAVGIATLSVVGVWLSARFQQHRLDDLELELVNQLKLVDFSLTSFMAEVESDIMALAENELVRTENDRDFTSFVNADEETFVYGVGELEQSIIDVFNTFRITHPYVNSVYMGRENGSFVRSHRRARPSQYDPRTRPWYILAKENPGKVMRTEPYQSVTTSDVNIGVVTALVGDDGGTYGVVGADVTLINLAEYLSGFEVGHQGQISLVDAAGTILVSQGPGFQFEDISVLLGSDAEYLMSDDQGVLVFATESESSYLFFYTSPALGWKMATVIPAHEVRKEIQSAVLPALSGLFLALALLSILTFIGLAVAVVRPLAHLNDAALEITRTGDLNREVEIETRDEIGYLATSFNQMVVSIRQSQETLRQQRDLAEALQDATIALTTSLDFETVLDRILEQVSRVIPNEACNIMLVENEQVRPVRWLGYERFGSEGYISDVVFSLSETPAFKWMSSSKEPVIISNVATDPDWVHLSEMSWLRSYAAAPIVVRDKVIGFLSVDSSIPDFFQQHQLEPLRAFASRAAIAIENAHLYEQAQEHANELEERVATATQEISQRADELAALYEVSRNLVTTLDLDALLPVVARRVTAALGADRCAVFLFNESANVLQARAAHGYAAERLANFGYRPGEEVVGQAYATGTPQYVPDLDLVPYMPRRDEIRAVLAVPLVGPTVGPSGVISVTSLRPEAFTLDQQRLLETMASQIAGGIESARLYQAAERHAAQLASLYEIGKEITSTLELDAMLHAIASEAARLVGADKSLILLIDAEKERLTRVVGYGYTQAQLNGHTFEEFQDGISGWVFREKLPTFSVDIQADERIQGKALASARQSDDRSAAVAPLLIESKVIGTLTVVNSRQARRFQLDDLNLVTMLAGQAAIAIQNAQLYEAAQEADHLKSAFLASMSHELRTPLNSIIGFTGIILQGLAGPLNPEQEKQLNMVRDSSRHLLNLINDVLDISKIEAGQLEIVPEPLDVKEAVVKVVRTMTPLAEKKGLELVAEVSPAVGQNTSDRRRVEQILINLVNNAIKFTDQGEVRVECQISGDWVVTRVVDTGIGIKHDDMDKLFEAFRQIDTGVARRHEGTGLGLSICRRLTEMLGGEIWAESEWGMGSTFAFTLPIRMGARHETQDSRHRG
jgi:signal transduction histidine kinase/putative methionine-R-sulfoxide reductase with GAF domain